MPRTGWARLALSNIASGGTRDTAAREEVSFVAGRNRGAAGPSSQRDPPQSSTPRHSWRGRDCGLARRFFLSPRQLRWSRTPRPCQRDQDAPDSRRPGIPAARTRPRTPAAQQTDFHRPSVSLGGRRRGPTGCGADAPRCHGSRRLDAPLQERIPAVAPDRETEAAGGRLLPSSSRYPSEPSSICQRFARS